MCIRDRVEAVLIEHPKVKEVAVIGVPDEHSSEAPMAIVVPRDASLTREELHAFAHEKLTGYKIPRHFEFRRELPKTNVGKILRRELRTEILARFKSVADEGRGKSVATDPK
ncbi:MAG: long-chain fatty acid--CoA ligase, partial [Methylocystis sp.]|nr:long-chain fatty acid--CoA ligase [Methylocystis sp.]